MSRVPRCPSSPPDVASWSPGLPAPLGYRVVEKPRKGLVIAGAATLGGGYVFSLLGAAMLPDRTRQALAFIPVAGPFAAMLAQGCGCSDGGLTCALGNAIGGIVLGIGGVVQVLGSLVLTVGLVSRETVLEPAVRPYALRPIPLFGPHWAGGGFTGSF
jgi:hypothetical protein